VRRKGKTGGTEAGHVTFEASRAVRAGVMHISSLTGLTIWQRFVVAMLKLIAIAGYHYGKWRASVSPPESRRCCQESQISEAVDRLVAAAPKQKIVTLGGRSAVAVVVPVYARTNADQVHLMAALDALSRQTRQPDYLVLVDDGSPLPIPSIISGARVMVLRMEVNSGPASARNAGLAVARKLGVQLVAFLDADCLPEPNWLAVMDRAQRRRPGIFAGRTMAAYPDTYVGLYHDVCGTLNGRRLKNGSLLYGCTCNLSVNLDRCSQDFDQSFPQAAFEDVEFCVRAAKSGLQVAYDGDAVVRHHYDHTAMGLFRQFARYGQFESQMCRRHSDYLEVLWASSDISSLSEVGLQLEAPQQNPPSDEVLLKHAQPSERAALAARPPLFPGVAGVTATADCTQ